MLRPLRIYENRVAELDMARHKGMEERAEDQVGPGKVRERVTHSGVYQTLNLCR